MKSLFFILLSLSFYLSAATVDTNQSAALVKDPAAVSDWNLTRQGILSVLSMKSGLDAAEISSRYSIDEAFKSAVLRSYRENVPFELGASTQWFNVAVDAEKIHELMLSNRIPVWPERRSELYVWVVEETDSQPLVHASNDSEAIYWLKKWFKVYGIPTVFYDASEADLLRFQPKDVRYLNPDLVDYVHANYEVSQSLLVFVKHTGSGYSYRFGLSRSEQPTMIRNLQFVDLAAGMKSLVTNIQQVMAEGQRLYAEEFNSSTVGVSVNAINDADQMLKLLNYLDNHALVEAYQINQLKNRKVELMMKIKVLPDTFIKFVEGEGVVQHLPLEIGNTLLFEMVK